MWLWLGGLFDIKHEYQKMDANEPYKYRRARRKFISIFLFFGMTIFATYQFFIYRCAKEVGDYTVCRFHGGNIEAANRLLAKRTGVRSEGDVE